MIAVIIIIIIVGYSYSQLFPIISFYPISPFLIVAGISLLNHPEIHNYPPGYQGMPCTLSARPARPGSLLWRCSNCPIRWPRTTVRRIGCPPAARDGGMTNGWWKLVVKGLGRFGNHDCWDWYVTGMLVYGIPAVIYQSQQYPSSHIPSLHTNPWLSWYPNVGMLVCWGPWLRYSWVGHYQPTNHGVTTRPLVTPATDEPTVGVSSALQDSELRFVAEAPPSYEIEAMNRGDSDDSNR